MKHYKYLTLFFLQSYIQAGKTTSVIVNYKNSAHTVLLTYQSKELKTVTIRNGRFGTPEYDEGYYYKDFDTSNSSGWKKYPPGTVIQVRDITTMLNLLMDVARKKCEG